MTFQAFLFNRALIMMMCIWTEFVVCLLLWLFCPVGSWDDTCKYYTVLNRNVTGLFFDRGMMMCCWTEFVVVVAVCPVYNCVWKIYKPKCKRNYPVSPRTRLDWVVVPKVPVLIQWRHHGKSRWLMTVTSSWGIPDDSWQWRHDRWLIGVTS